MTRRVGILLALAAASRATIVLGDPVPAILSAPAGSTRSADRIRARQILLAAGVEAEDAETIVERARAARAKRPPEAAERALGAAEDELSRGRRAAAMLDDEEAARRFGAAQALLGQAVAVPGVARRLGEVALADAARLFAAGQREAARRRLFDAVRWAPERILTQREAHPGLVELHQAISIASLSKAGAQARLAVHGEPVGAEVFVDDRPQGPTPLVIVLPPGEHLVRLEAEGYESWGALLRVEPGEFTLSPTLGLDERARSLSRLAGAIEARDADTVGRGLVAAREALGARELALAIGVRWHGRLGLLLQRARRGGFTVVERYLLDLERSGLELSVPSSEMRPVLTLFSDRWLTHPEPDVPRPPRTPWWRRWYVLAPAAAVVAGAVALAIVALQPTEPSIVIHYVPPR